MDHGPNSVDEYITQLKRDMDEVDDTAEDLLVKMGQSEGRRIKLFGKIDAALAILARDGGDAEKMAVVQWDITQIQTDYQGITGILEECVGDTQSLSSLTRGILRHCSAIATLCEAGMEVAQGLKYEIYLAARSTLDIITFLSKEAFGECQKYCGQLERTVAAVKAKQAGIPLPEGDTVGALTADLARFKGALNQLKIASLGTPFNLQIENLKAKLRFAKAIVESLG